MIISNWSVNYVSVTHINCYVIVPHMANDVHGETFTYSSFSMKTRTVSASIAMDYVLLYSNYIFKQYYVMKIYECCLRNSYNETL